MRFWISFCLSVGAVLALLAADPQQPKVGNTQVINATNGYGGILTVRTQVNVGYPGEPGILTLQSTNGTYTLTIQYDTDGALLIQPESLDAFDVPALRVKPGTAITMGNIQDWEDGNGVLRMSLEIEGTLFTRRLFAINDGIPNGDQWTRIQYGDITIHPDLATNTILLDANDHSITMWQSGITNFYVAPSSGNDGTAGLFLAADGLYHAVTSPPGTVITPGDPTALIGLTTVTGVSALYMRADSAPRINQGITPEWTGTHLWTESPGSLSVSVRPTGTATNNLTGKDSPFISLSSIVWDGVAAYSPSFFIANKVVSGVNSAYRLTVDSSEHAPVFTVSNSSGYTDTGGKYLNDAGLFQAGVTRVLSNYTTVSTNLSATTTDIYTAPSGTRVLWNMYASTTNATPGTVTLKVKSSGNYYKIASTPSFTPSLTTINSVSPALAYVLESGESVAVTTTQQGVSIWVTAVMIPTTSFLKTIKSTLVSGDNTVYTVPTGYKVMGVLSSGLGGPANGVGDAITQSSGGNLTYKRYWNSIQIDPGIVVTSGAPLGNQMVNLNSGDVIVVNSTSSDVSQLYWTTVYEIPN